MLFQKLIHLWPHCRHPRAVPLLLDTSLLLTYNLPSSKLAREKQLPPQVVTYNELQPGREFPPVTHRLTPDIVAGYLAAVRDSSSIYASPEDIRAGSFKPSSFVPPAAVAALAMRGLLDAIVLPPGSVHVSQDLDFLKPVSINDNITCRVSVGRKQERAALRLVSFDFTVIDNNGAPVMTGKTLVTIPGSKRP